MRGMGHRPGLSTKMRTDPPRAPSGTPNGAEISRRPDKRHYPSPKMPNGAEILQQPSNPSQASLPSRSNLMLYFSRSCDELDRWRVVTLVTGSDACDACD